MDYPKPLLLHYPYHLDPCTLNSLKRGLSVQITESKQLIIHGSVFTSDDPLPVGEEGTIWPSRFYAELYLKKELEAYLIWQQQQQQLNEQQQAALRIQKAQARRQASDEFYRSRRIPFAFSIEIKEVLSGLSAGSWGDGQRKNTVYHIYTKEEVSQGRFHRPKGEFLCSSVKSRSGANWSDSLGQDSHQLDADGVRQVPTCKRCLEILERFSITNT